MKTLKSQGHKITNVDKKALDHYLLTTPKEWLKGALDGMINKSIKTILNDYLEIYKEKQTGNITKDLSVLIPAILQMSEFKKYNVPTPLSFDNCPKKISEGGVIQREENRNMEICAGGFQIEDYQELALNAFYENPETMLDWFMENKIYQRRKAMVNEVQQEMMRDPEVYEIPSKQDAIINLKTSKANYKNRAQQDAEILTRMQ